MWCMAPRWGFTIRNALWRALAIWQRGQIWAKVRICGINHCGDSDTWLLKLLCGPICCCPVQTQITDSGIAMLPPFCPFMTNRGISCPGTQPTSKLAASFSDALFLAIRICSVISSSNMSSYNWSPVACTAGQYAGRAPQTEQIALFPSNPWASYPNRLLQSESAVMSKAAKYSTLWKKLPRICAIYHPHLLHLKTNYVEKLLYPF